MELTEQPLNMAIYAIAGDGIEELDLSSEASKIRYIFDMIWGENKWV